MNLAAIFPCKGSPGFIKPEAEGHPRAFKLKFDDTFDNSHLAIVPSTSLRQTLEPFSPKVQVNLADKHLIL